MNTQFKVEKSVIEIGLEKPIKLLHFTDCHFNIEKESTNTDYFLGALEYAKEHSLIPLTTGDVTDGYSEENSQFLKAHFPKGENVFMPGNHDFSLKPGDVYFKDETYRDFFMEKWAPFYTLDINFDSTIIGGVNFVTLENNFYSITHEQLELLKEEVKKGLPIILCMHIPLYIEGTQFPTLPEKVMAADEDVCEYILKTDLIKAAISGHIHENFDGISTLGKRQIVTAPLKEGYIREIEIR